MVDTHRERLNDLMHCPDLTGSAAQRAYQADRDAAQLAADIREVDPREVWGRINRWGKEEPERLLAAVVSLAALADSNDHILGRAPAWCREIGGTAALQPDYSTAPADVRHSLPLERDVEILRLARAKALSDQEIALRVGVSSSTVQRVRAAAGLTGQPGGSTATLDSRVAELHGLDWRPDAIAQELGVSVRTVERARTRNASIEERPIATIHRGRADPSTKGAVA